MSITEPKNTGAIVPRHFTAWRKTDCLNDRRELSSISSTNWERLSGSRVWTGGKKTRNKDALASSYMGYFTWPGTSCEIFGTQAANVSRRLDRGMIHLHPAYRRKSNRR